MLKIFQLFRNINIIFCKKCLYIKITILKIVKGRGEDKMDINEEFLNYIYQNAEMGKNTISQLIGITKDETFKGALESQLREYNQIYDAADSKMKQISQTPKSIGTIPKVSTYLTINMKTMTNKSPAHIAEMMIQGSTMGIIDVTKRIKEYNNAGNDVKELANRLLKFEQKNVEQMKKFL